MTEEEFKVEMLKRGWSDAEIQRSIVRYRTLKQKKGIGTLTIDFLLCNPVNQRTYHANEENGWSDD